MTLRRAGAAFFAAGRYQTGDITTIIAWHGGIRNATPACLLFLTRRDDNDDILTARCSGACAAARVCWLDMVRTHAHAHHTTRHARCTGKTGVKKGWLEEEGHAWEMAGWRWLDVVIRHGRRGGCAWHGTSLTRAAGIKLGWDRHQSGDSSTFCCTSFVWDILCLDLSTACTTTMSHHHHLPATLSFLLPSWPCLPCLVPSFYRCLHLLPPPPLLFLYSPSLPFCLLLSSSIFSYYYCLLTLPSSYHHHLHYLPFSLLLPPTYHHKSFRTGLFGQGQICLLPACGHSLLNHTLPTTTQQLLYVWHCCSGQCGMVWFSLCYFRFRAFIAARVYRHALYRAPLLSTWPFQYRQRYLPYLFRCVHVLV